MMDQTTTSDIATEPDGLQEQSAMRAEQSDEIELFEMANLTSKKTGVEGVIYISTSQAGHAPRVKWYPERPQDGAPCLVVTIEQTPAAINKNLRQSVADAAADRVQAWVRLNCAALLEFWFKGNSWFDEEVDNFKKGLKSLP